MKVSVLGAGAIGSMLGGLLARDAPDVEVVLVARGDHGRVLAERGTVRLDGPWGRCDVPIASSSDPAAVAGSQFVFITVKSQDTEPRSPRPRPIGATRPSSRSRTASTIIGCPRSSSRQRLVMGMTATNMALVEPGRVSLQLGRCDRFRTAVGHESRGDMTASAAAARC